MPVGLVLCKGGSAFLAKGIGRSATVRRRTDRVDHGPYAVEILDLASLAKLAGVLSRDRYIDIDPHTAVLHVGIASPDGLEQALYLPDISCGLDRGSEIGLRDDLYERSACAIQVDQR